MNWNFHSCLSLFEGEKAQLLHKGLHGLEKESLRVQKNGVLALTPHPKSLSDPLTDPNLTTDFSESQIEFITDPHPSIEAALTQLEGLHERAWEHLGDELLWPLSMPCILPPKDEIPIAQYGDSEDAQRRTRYREGLAHRYGKTMQTLCGIHYNFSFNDEFWDALHQAFAPEEDRQTFINEKYLSLVRNFARYRWLLVALFGASPLCDESYKCKAAQHNKGTAASLRMSKCGYTNPAKMDIEYNNYSVHLASIQRALDTHHPPYEGAGLNANLLQIPNEYYFSIRLKPNKAEPDNMKGLRENGVEYIEVRLFDLNPFEFIGVNAEQLRFTQLFLLTCLFSESMELSPEVLAEATANQELVAIKGRQQDLVLMKEGEPIALHKWTKKVFDHMQPLAEAMGSPYRETLAKIQSTDHWLADDIMKELSTSNESHVEFGLRLAQEFQERT